MKKDLQLSLGVILLALIMQFTVCVNQLTVFAQVVPTQPAPEKLRVEAMYGDQPAIGYNEYDGYYVDLKWDPLKNPQPNIAVDKYMNFYLQEITKPYKPQKPIIIKESNVLANQNSPTQIRLKNLSSGTIYYTYATAWYTYIENNVSYKSPESVPSNMVKFMTDIRLDAYSYGSRQIKIIWDDVWESGKRIDYKLYVSEDKSFANTPPIYIRQEDIGEGKAVTVNEENGKLEYIYTVRDPGRVYYIKIEPDIADTSLKYSKESNIVAASSYILARTTKMASTESGTVWKIEWIPVVTGLNMGDVKITYHIYRGNLNSTDVPKYEAAVDDNVFITVLTPEEEKTCYFIIRAVITRNGQNLYPGINIESDKIIIKESGIPAIPAAPELVNEFKDIDGRTIISYEENLKPTSATLLWKVPVTGEGTSDLDVVYDIWLIDDPNQVESSPDQYKIASSLKMSTGNMVMDGNRLVGYKYTISGLTPNKIYYFKIVAKKSYIDNVDGELQEVILSSEPAIKIVITPAQDNTTTPVVPGRPPLKLKEMPGSPGKYMVSENTVVIQLKDKWYEEYNENTKKWEYRTSEELGKTIVDQLENGTNSNKYRIVQYDAGISIDVGCVEYTEDMDYKDIASLPANKVTGFPVTPNDPYEDGSLNPDRKKHNIDIILSDLKPNTSYIIWVRAVRTEYGLVSGPSDPIIVTTNPQLPATIEKPVVPTFNYYYAGDNYVDLGWDVKAGYYYYIKYATKDDINSAIGTVEIKPEDLYYSTYYTVKGLEQDTVYYFWIQAEVRGADGTTARSDWSDSLVVRTLPYIPPETPKGFGVKNSKDAVTKNSITYEWIMEEGMEYILEVASDIDYADSEEFEVGNVSEYKVEGLRSNYRYYARLYAYDPEKKLRSEPTQTVICRTKRSLDDYDSDEYTEEEITGDYIQKEYTKRDNTWTIRIEGVNADRFIENMKNDNEIDYILDLRNPPYYGTRRIVLSVSGRVFAAMGQLKENIIILTPVNRIIMPYGIFSGTTSQSYNSIYEITIILKNTSNELPASEKTNGIKFESDITGLEVYIKTGQLKSPVYKFDKPMQIIYTFPGSKISSPGEMTGLIYDINTSEWKTAGTRYEYNMDLDLSRFVFDMPVAGGMAVGCYSRDKFSDISSSRFRDAINNVASLHELKSVKGTAFRTGDNLTIADAVKFILDVMDYNYGNDYLVVALRAGIIDKSDADSPEKGCTREKALAIAVRLYELKTGKKAKASGEGVYPFEDISKISKELYDRVTFAVENGFVSYRYSNLLEPQEVILRGEFMGIIENVLEFVGELD